METKHTPGPWVACSGNAGEHFNIECKTSDNDCLPIARIIGPDRRANAALIAQAPDLLAERDRLLQVNAELVAALEWVLQFDPDGDGGMPDYKELRHVCDTARAALAKAKGE